MRVARNTEDKVAAGPDELTAILQAVRRLTAFVAAAAAVPCRSTWRGCPGGSRPAGRRRARRRLAADRTRRLGRPGLRRPRRGRRRAGAAWRAALVQRADVLAHAAGRRPSPRSPRRRPR